MKPKFLIPLLIIITISAQDKKTFDNDIDHAYANAKKGIYFALSNVPVSKNSLQQDLIENDILIASIKLSKETNGVKVKSSGIYKTYSVEIIVYRSYESLEKDGY